MSSTPKRSAGKPRALKRGAAARRSVRSWGPIDPDYSKRVGYDRDFLDLRVNVPRPASQALRKEVQAALKYEHFSVVMHRSRKLAAFTAVNIDGAREYRFGGRSPDSWHLDPRAPELQTTQAFYRKPFNRGHLVMRIDPAWGTQSEGMRAEADTFHWTNCTPQHGKLNNPRWLGIENHILNTANNTDRRASVFSGPVFSEDPVIRNVQIPLAFWKVLVWRAVPGRKLRALGFLVRQDDLVLPLVSRGARATRRALADFSPVPQRIRTYQTRVSEIENLTQLNFGSLADPSIDVYAKAQPARGARHALAALVRYRPIADLSELVL